jgi:hypothetical protein
MMNGSVTPSKKDEQRIPTNMILCFASHTKIPSTPLWLLGIFLFPDFEIFLLLHSLDRVLRNFYSGSLRLIDCFLHGFLASAEFTLDVFPV